MLKRSSRKLIFSALRYSILTVWLFVVLFPIYWIVATSFKQSSEWIAWPPVWWSNDPTFSSYFYVWISGVLNKSSGTEVLGPWASFMNSFIIAFSASVIATFMGAVIAYGASRYQI